MSDFSIPMLVFFLPIGGGLIFGGVSQVTASSNAPVTCGTQVMDEGDVCRETRSGGPVGAKNYAEKKAEQAPSLGKTIWGIILILGGTAVTIGCVIGIRNKIRERR